MRGFSWCKEAVLDLLFPPQCVGCSTLGQFLCSECRTALHWLAPSCFGCGALVPGAKGLAGRTCVPCRRKSAVFAFLSPFSYDDEVIRELIHAFKYRRVYSLDQLCADLLIEYFSRMDVGFDPKSVVVPIPLHKSRERVRGFNQSERIARLVGMRLGLRVAGDVLIRHKKTAPQVGLPEQERRNNVKDSFSLVSSELIRGRTLILVDDVKTTGATIEEAARILKKAGAARVLAMTLAH